MKERIDRLVDIYLAGIQSVSEDAGWMGESMLARAIIFAGDIPPPSGNCRGEDPMIKAIEMIRKQHAKFHLAKLLITSLPKDRNGKDSYKIALLASRWYDGRRDDNGKKYNDFKIALRAEMGERAYRHSRDKAYEILGPLVAFSDRMKELMVRAERERAA